MRRDLLEQLNENFVANPDWFDYEVKEKYLNSVSESQRTYIMFLLKKMSIHEKSVGEPLYNQTTSNIESFLYSLQPLTRQTSYKGLGYVIRYMRFAAELGVKDSNIILIESSFDYADKFVPQNARTFITRDQLEAIIDNCRNFQDKVIFRLIFEGLKGSQLSELRFLKPNEVYKKQVDGNEQYFIDINSSDKNNRTIPISENLYSLCQYASAQETYLLNNGNEVDSNIIMKRGTEQDLVDTGYILKRSKIGKNAADTDSTISYHGLYSRMKRIMDYEEFNDIDADYMKSGTLYQSGALYEAYKIIDAEYANGLLEAYIKEEKDELYSKVDFLSLRRKVLEKFIYVQVQKSKNLISLENMIKYY